MNSTSDSFLCSLYTGFWYIGGLEALLFMSKDAVVTYGYGRTEELQCWWSGDPPNEHFVAISEPCVAGCHQDVTTSCTFAPLL